MMVALGKHIKLVGGGTPSKAIEEYWNGSIPWASVKDLKSGYLSSTQDFISQKGVENSSTKVIPKGTLLIATRMAVGKVAIPSIDVAINQDLKAIYCNSSLNQKFLFYVLKSKADYFDSVATGATVKGIKINHITDLQIPLPPLPQQQRIVNILDAADELRQNNRLLIAKYDELKQSIFLDMFGDPNSNSLQWKIKTLGEFFDIKGGKRLPKGANFQESKSNYPYLRVTNFQRNSFNDKKLKYISRDTHLAIKNYIISSNDVYISIAGTIGVAGYIPANLDGANLTENAAKIVCKNGVKCSREYLSFYLNTDFVQKIISSKTMAVGVPKLALFRIQEIPFIDVPYSLQNQFKERLVLIEEQKALTQKSLEKSEELFNSLLQKAFNGELV
jgi:type I restriction enzyme S subunit